MSKISPLARAAVRALTPYASARRSMSGGDVWLNANENALAPTYTISGCYNRYPSCQPTELLSAYAEYAGVCSEQVLVSRGADEGIELLIRSFCEPGRDSIVICPPTYGMYAISAESNGVARNIVPLKADVTLDVPAILAQPNSKLVFVCSPNNPTGDLIPREQIIKLLAALQHRALVVVDEAYIEFIQSASVVDLLARYPNLVILRTLSKAFGLAGLRCGFTLGAPEVIAALKQMIAPYPLAAPVIDIALQALGDAGIQTMWQTVATINQLRDEFVRFASSLTGVSRVFSSNANYVLLAVDDAQGWVNALAAQGTLIRNQSAQAGLDGLGVAQVIRVSIGSPTEMSLLQKQMAAYSAISAAEPAPALAQAATQ